jgi:FkbM family methyltransferase
VLFPLLDERAYRFLQSVSKAWDIATGSWSEPELDLVPRAVHRGETAIDIGANYGLYTFHLSRAVGAAGRVYAFEPIPFTHQTLRSVVRLLGLKNVELLALGCGERAGRLTFRMPIDSSGPAIAGLAHRADRNDARPGRESEEAAFPTREVVCDVIAIDELLPDLRRLAFIKCDIEGAELLAFRGARQVIETHLPTVVCEVNPWYLEGFGIRIEELAGFFLERGYGLYRWTPGAKVTESSGLLVPTAIGDIRRGNLIFLHPSRQGRLDDRIAGRSSHLLREAA